MSSHTEPYETLAVQVCKGCCVFKQMECDANLRRAKQVYMTRCEEYDKARTAANRAEEEGGSSTTKTVDKKKRLEEEARNKVRLGISHMPL